MVGYGQPAAGAWVNRQVHRVLTACRLSIVWDEQAISIDTKTADLSPVPMDRKKKAVLRI